MGDILEKLPQNTKFRTGVLSMLVSLYLANDQRAKAATLLKNAMEISKKFPDFVSKSVDVDALESSATMSRYGKKATIGSPNPQTPEQVSEETKKKRRKKRKKRLPKSFNPNVDPDPERWVPRRERTGYRRTRK